MDRRIVWMHGIGRHTRGYSDPWRTQFDRFLGQPRDAYPEVIWDTVFHPAAPAAPEGRQAAVAEAIALTPQEELAAREYVVSRGVRTAVKEACKRLLRPLAGQSVAVSVIAHSWGSVVAYDSLLDLSAELPDLRVANLFTLGSPLWLVRRFLEARSGRKPANLSNFVNVHARGDVVGSWLKPAFRVDKDFQVPSVGGDAHGSYFVEGNEAVQRTIVAVDVLDEGRPPVARHRAGRERSSAHRGRERSRPQRGEEA